MMSPWLVETTYEIAQLLCPYTPKGCTVSTLPLLYECIEYGRETQNLQRQLVDQYEEEWSLVPRKKGFSLFYRDHLTRQISLLALDASDKLVIKMGENGYEILDVHLTGSGTAYRNTWNERLLVYDEHIAFLRTLHEEIFGGKLLDEPLVKLPSYLVH